MSKETMAIAGAYHLGMNAKIDRRPYKNPFDKSKEKRMYKAYKNGYNEGVVRKD